MSEKIVAPAYVAAMARAETDPAAARFWIGLDIGFKSTMAVAGRRRVYSRPCWRRWPVWWSAMVAPT